MSLLSQPINLTLTWAYLEEKKKTQDDIEKEENAQEQAIKKGQLRKLVNKLGQSTVIEVS